MTKNEYCKKIGRRYQRDPVYFTEHALGSYTWSKMREILMSVAKNKYTAVKACHGSSKTFTAACIVIWFFNMFINAKIITTAPTGDQVKLLLWTDIGKVYRTAPLELTGECLTAFLKDPKRQEHFAHGFSTDRPQRAEGWHAPKILFVLDEAKGIEQWMWDSMVGALGSGFCRVLAISTTDGIQAGEKFHKIFTDKKQKKRWNRISIDVFDLPEFTGEKLRTRDFDTGKITKKKIQDLPGIQLSGKAWEKERKEDWLKDGVLYLTKVRGEIVDETPDSIIKLSQTRKMFDNGNNSKFDSVNAAEQVGVDVAFMGDDFTTFYGRRGIKVYKKDRMKKMHYAEQADRLEIFVNFKKLKREVKIKLDVTGYGAGLYSEMHRRGYKNLYPINFNQVAKDPDKYPDAISEMWFEMAEFIDETACIEDDRLQAQLTSRRKLPLDKKGRRCVEDKKAYKKRMKESPDEADGFLLTYYEPDESDGSLFGYSEGGY